MACSWSAWPFESCDWLDCYASLLLHRLSTLKFLTWPWFCCVACSVRLMGGSGGLGGGWRLGRLPMMVYQLVHSEELDYISSSFDHASHTPICTSTSLNKKSVIKKDAFRYTLLCGLFLSPRPLFSESAGNSLESLYSIHNFLLSPRGNFGVAVV